MQPKDLHGRIVDLDSHLALLPEDLTDILGPGPGGDPWPGAFGGPSLLQEVQDMMASSGLDGSNLAESLAAARQRASQDVWSEKEWGAHGAQVALDRVEAMAQMGIASQLVFHQFMEAALNARGPEAAGAVARYNDYVLDWARVTRGRAVPVCLLNLTDPTAALAEANRVIGRGARVLEIPAVLPPAGLSPCAPEWEPLWSTMAEARARLVVHAGSAGGQGSFINPAWSRLAAETLRPPAGDPSAADPHAPPFFWTTAYFAIQVTLTFMILGGVFQRHPDLQFGVIELGAGWVAPWAENLDVVAASTSDYLSRTLELKPSEYVRRQIRVSPFVFEPVGTWVERSGFDEVYVFSTDYPHFEGGDDPIHDFFRSVAPRGDAVVERFFVTNGADFLSVA